LPRLAKTAFRNVVHSYREACRALKRGGGKADMDISDALSVSAPGANPLEILAAQDAAYAIMANILQHASPTMKRIVPLLIDGYDYTEIEQLLGIGKGSAKIQVSKLRSQLGIDPKARPIEQVDRSGVVIAIHDNLKVAAKSVNVTPQAIGAVVRREQSCFTVAGYHWRYRRRAA
jgi:hypothetical protein